MLHHVAEQDYLVGEGYDLDGIFNLSRHYLDWKKTFEVTSLSPGKIQSLQHRVILERK